MKLDANRPDLSDEWQPPSGGCVLKQMKKLKFGDLIGAAAFRRLCVETVSQRVKLLTPIQPPSGGCVLKLVVLDNLLHSLVSRLQAAVC